MKQPWLAYGVVALLAAGVGVLVAGVPDLDPAEATIATPGTPDTGNPSTTAPGTTLAPAATTAPPATAPATTTTTATTATAATTTTVADDADELPDRADIAVVVANGSGVPRAAAFVAGVLQGNGYVDVEVADGTEPFQQTIVFYAEGFEGAALRLAADLDLDLDTDIDTESSVLPLIDAPPIEPAFPDAALLVYLGRDPG
jgi:hypothetical protein